MSKPRNLMNESRGTFTVSPTAVTLPIPKSSAKERPIIFNTEMVAAILQGRKTQTRRVMKIQPPWKDATLSQLMDTTDLQRTKNIGKFNWVVFDAVLGYEVKSTNEYFSCQYGKPGDRLWVKEAFCVHDWRYPRGPIEELREAVRYFADLSPIRKYQTSWYDPRFMPRWASRILLEITDVRVERLQDISVGGMLIRSDVLKEGCPGDIEGDAKAESEWFSNLWDSIYSGEKSWEANPWVWVIDFRRIE